MFDVPKYRNTDFPQIGKVTAMNEDEVTVLWFTGTITGVWREVRGGWKEDVCKSTLFYSNLEFTQGAKLTVEARNAITQHTESHNIELAHAN